MVSNSVTSSDTSGDAFKHHYSDDPDRTLTNIDIKDVNGYPSTIIDFIAANNISPFEVNDVFKPEDLNQAQHGFEKSREEIHKREGSVDHSQNSCDGISISKGPDTDPEDEFLADLLFDRLLEEVTQSMDELNIETENGSRQYRGYAVVRQFWDEVRRQLQIDEQKDEDR